MRAKNADYQKKIKDLEESGDFNEHTLVSHSKHFKTIDKDYVYIPTSFGFKVLSCIVNAVLTLIGPILIFFGHGVRVKGRKNLLKEGAFSIANHVLYLDYLIVRYALRGRKVYFTVAPENIKDDVRGSIFKAARTLPIGRSMASVKNLNAAMKQVLDQNQYVHFYPEQALWLRYEAPRPFKKGVFYCAAKHKKPVQPVMLLFREAKGFRKWFKMYPPVTVQIMPAIYPKEDLGMRDNENYLKECAEKAFRDEYERFYNKTYPILSENHAQKENEES